MENLSINDLLICGFILFSSYVFIITFSNIYYTIYNDNTKCNNKEIALDNIDNSDDSDDYINLLHI